MSTVGAGTVAAATADASTRIWRTAALASVILMTALLALQIGVLWMPRESFDLMFDGVLPIATELMPAVVCWMAVARTRERRREAIWISIAVTSYALGNLVFVGALMGGVMLPTASPAAIGYLGFYPAVFAALLVAVRRLGVRGSEVWLDCVLAGLTSAALVSLFLQPLFNDLMGRLTLSSVIATLYPVFDLVLIAGIGSAAALYRYGMAPRWIALFAGLTVFLSADIVFALQVAASSYVVGTPLDAAWSVGLALIAVFVAAPAERRQSAVRGSVPLVVPTLATVICVALLVGQALRPSAVLTVILAAIVLLAAAARIQVAFAQQRRDMMYRREARSDELTGLANRREFYDYRPRADQPSECALVLVDIDALKEINEALGHEQGDELLIQAAERLKRVAPEGAMIARVGGDEFAILLPDPDPSSIAGLYDRIQEAMDPPMSLGSSLIRAPVSVGVALGSPAQLDLLSHRAHNALRIAKRSGAGHLRYASEEAAGTELGLLRELRQAAVGGELRLHYQPKVTLPTRDVQSVEALLRWQHPTRGLLMPAAFLPMAQEAGLMPVITDWVFDQALEQAAAWWGAGWPVRIAVNVSGDALVDESLPNRLLTNLADRGLKPACLSLEITEDLLMRDRLRASRILARLRDAGVQVALDDFGTGYSSLAYLRDLPVDEIKLDRSFVAPMLQDPRAHALVVTAITLAHELGLRVVAEGVEEEAALDRLARARLRRGAGPLPVPADGGYRPRRCSVAQPGRVTRQIGPSAASIVPAAHVEAAPPGGDAATFAEDGGFEPPRLLHQHAFQACAIGH